MPLTPALPAPLPKWAKVLVRAAPWIQAGLENLYDHISDASQVEDVQWRYVVLRWARSTPVGTSEDYAQIGFHVVNITNGDIDPTWTTTDYQTCETHLNEWLLGINGRIDQGFTLVDYRWYQKAFANPMTAEKRFADSGPPLRVTVKNTVGGTLGAPLPYQVACSITLKTPAPRHWGRVYLPGMGPGDIDANGRWGQSLLTLLANQTAELVDDLAGSEFFMLVPTTQENGSLVSALSLVTAVQVDDIPDVIRRRRARAPKIRTIGVPNP